jgi:hypothetical protein
MKDKKYHTLFLDLCRYAFFPINRNWIYDKWTTFTKQRIKMQYLNVPTILMGIMNTLDPVNTNNQVIFIPK